MYNIYSSEPSNFNARGDESNGCLLSFAELISALFLYSIVACNMLRHSWLPKQSWLTFLPY